ncbi:MAG: nucleotide exchange factor GrpE [Planctomycetota bacterium]
MQQKKKETPESEKLNRAKQGNDREDEPGKIPAETPAGPVCETVQEEETILARKLQKEIDELKKLALERDEFLAMLQRVQADFSNYQKRSRQEKICWEQYRDEEILKELLPAFDNLERTVKIKCESRDAVCLQEGIDLTEKEIFRILEKRKVIRIKTIGEKFNPARHEAVGIRETVESEPGIIVEEIRAGYLLQERILRPAQVIISANPQQQKL